MKSFSFFLIFLVLSFGWVARAQNTTLLFDATPGGTYGTLKRPTAAEFRDANGVSASSNELDAFASIEGAAIVVRVGPGRYLVRTIAAGTGVTVTYADGIAGNPTISIGQSVATTASPLFANLNLPAGGAILGAGTLAISAGGTGNGLSIQGSATGSHTNNLFTDDAAGSALNIGSVSGNLTINVGGLMRPRATAQFDLGTSSLLYRQGFFSGKMEMGSAKIGPSGTVVGAVYSATGALDYSEIAAGAEATLTVTVTGASPSSTSNSVHLGWSAALPDGVVVKQVWVSAVNTVSVRVRNVTASPIDPASVTCRATVIEI